MRASRSARSCPNIRHSSGATTTARPASATAAKIRPLSIEPTPEEENTGNTNRMPMMPVTISIPPPMSRIR
jgi:hypothetical protein